MQKLKAYYQDKIAALEKAGKEKDGKILALHNTLRSKDSDHDELMALMAEGHEEQ